LAITGSVPSGIIFTSSTGSTGSRVCDGSIDLISAKLAGCWSATARRSKGAQALDPKGSGVSRRRRARPANPDPKSKRRQAGKNRRLAEGKCSGRESSHGRRRHQLTEEGVRITDVKQADGPSQGQAASLAGHHRRAAARGQVEWYIGDPLRRSAGCVPPRGRAGEAHDIQHRAKLPASGRRASAWPASSCRRRERGNICTVGQGHTGAVRITPNCRLEPGRADIRPIDSQLRECSKIGDVLRVGQNPSVFSFRGRGRLADIKLIRKVIRRSRQVSTIGVGQTP